MPATQIRKEFFFFKNKCGTVSLRAGSSAESWTLAITHFFVFYDPSVLEEDTRGKQGFQE